jgi:hypothetical protein
MITFLEERVPPDVSIVAAEVSPYHRMAYYGPPSLARRLVYLAEPELAIRYLGHDTIDRGLLALRPWFPSRIEPYAQFIAREPRFFVFGYIGEWSWLTYQLPRDGLEVTVVGRRQNRLLLEVRRTAQTVSPARR